jgi:hypothetical protein
VIERLFFIIIFYMTFSDLKDGQENLATHTLVRIIVLDLIFPIIYFFITFIFVKKNMVTRLPLLKTISHIYIVVTLLGGLLHIILMATDDVTGQFRIMVAAVFCLTECFNAFLMFVYLRTAQKYVGKLLPHL